jgi:hypothetical protein
LEAIPSAGGRSFILRDREPNPQRIRVNPDGKAAQLRAACCT